MLRTALPYSFVLRSHSPITPPRAAARRCRPPRCTPPRSTSRRQLGVVLLVRVQQLHHDVVRLRVGLREPRPHLRLRALPPGPLVVLGVLVPGHEPRPRFHLSPPRPARHRTRSTPRGARSPRNARPRRPARRPAVRTRTGAGGSPSLPGPSERLLVQLPRVLVALVLAGQRLQHGVVQCLREHLVGAGGAEDL